VTTWTNSGLLDKAKERFKELEHKGWEWRSFYNGFLEGASEALEYAKKYPLDRPDSETVCDDQLRTGDLSEVHHDTEEWNDRPGNGDL